jgi:hypothetical protein
MKRLCYFDAKIHFLCAPSSQKSFWAQSCGCRRESESWYCQNVCRLDVGLSCLFYFIFTVLDYKLTKRLPRYLTSTEVRRNTQREELALEQEQGVGSLVGIPGNAAMLTRCSSGNWRLSLLCQGASGGCYSLTGVQGSMWCLESGLWRRVSAQCGTLINADDRHLGR